MPQPAGRMAAGDRAMTKATIKFGKKACKCSYEITPRTAGNPSSHATRNALEQPKEWSWETGKLTSTLRRAQSGFSSVRSKKQQDQLHLDLEVVEMEEARDQALEMVREAQVDHDVPVCPREWEELAQHLQLDLDQDQGQCHLQEVDQDQGQCLQLAVDQDQNQHHLPAVDQDQVLLNLLRQ